MEAVQLGHLRLGHLGRGLAERGLLGIGPSWEVPLVMEVIDFQIQVFDNHYSTNYYYKYSLAAILKAYPCAMLQGYDVLCIPVMPWTTVRSYHAY